MAEIQTIVWGLKSIKTWQYNYQALLAFQVVVDFLFTHSKIEKSSAPKKSHVFLQSKLKKSVEIN